ncbi:hypothetical protein BJF78_00650 [Pseudonocardia sp. CNS-139]|nr:hypothetical protein BJF78_00650 [Pseudonocardia sp. CNS-139]
MYGDRRPTGTVEVVEGDLDADRFALLYRRAGRVVGGLAWNLPRAARTLRQEVLRATAAPPDRRVAQVEHRPGGPLAARRSSRVVNETPRGGAPDVLGSATGDRAHRVVQTACQRLTARGPAGTRCSRC